MRATVGARKEEGLRERKRRETLQRISEVGLGLFMTKGYDATTLDEIAAQAGISRRTFFYYFESKEDILLAYVDVYAEALKASVRASGASRTPLATVQNALTTVFGGMDSAKLLMIVRFMNESMTLRIKRRKDSLFEQAIFEALCEIWPAKNRRARLRLVTMASVGTMRVAVGLWRDQDGKRPLPSYIRDAFADLRTEISGQT